MGKVHQVYNWVLVYLFATLAFSGSGCFRTFGKERLVLCVTVTDLFVVTVPAFVGKAGPGDRQHQNRFYFQRV